MKKGLYLLIVLLVLSSCTSKKILSTMTNKPQSIGYSISLLALKSSDSEDAMNVEVDYSLVNFPLESKVEKESLWVIPLLFVNAWEAKYAVGAGQDMYTTNVEGYVSNAFEIALSSYSVAPYSNDPDARFRLKVNVDELSIDGQYVSKGFCIIPVFFYILSENVYLTPPEAKLSVSYELYDNDSLIFKSKYSDEYVLPEEELDKSYLIDEKDLQEYIPKAYAKSLSSCVKAVAKSVIEETNYLVPTK